MATAIFNTQYNKAVYVGAYNAILTVISLVLRDYAGTTISPELYGALTTLGSSLITLWVPNKEVS